MELLLDLRFPVGAARQAIDVTVELDADDSISSLRDALVDFAVRRQCLSNDVDPGTVALHRGGETHPLDTSQRVVDTHLLSGDTLRLGVSAGGWAAPDTAPTVVPATTEDALARGGLALDIAGGPHAGRIVPLEVGRFTIGRSPGCHVAIADPMLSREHLAIDVAADGSVHVLPNPDARNGTLVENRRVEGSRTLRLGELIRVGGSVLSVRSAVPEATRRRDQLGQVPLNRVPYRRIVVREQSFDNVRSAPTTPKGRRISIITAMAPMVMGLTMYLILDRWYLLIMTTMSPILMVLRTIGNKRGGKKKYAEDRDDFYRRVETRAAEVDAALEDERRVRLAAAPDLADLARQAMFHMPRLWERNRDAGDALELRIGLGDTDSMVTAGVAGSGDDELREQALDRLAYQSTVPDVPVTLSLTEMGTIGLWGDPEQVASTGRALICQATCLHSPEDLIMTAAIGEPNRQGFEWLKWLPHSRSATTPLAGEHLAVGPDAARNLLSRLMRVVSDRSARQQDRTGHWPKVLLVLDETAQHDRSLLAQLLDVAPTFGIHLIWLGQSELQVPRQCQAIISCPGVGQPGQVGFTSPELDDREVELDGALVATARFIARSLAPLRDASAAGQTTAIPRIVPLLDVVGLNSPQPEDLMKRWAVDRPYGLSFPLGLAPEGDFWLDLVDQGPHTLIGGTSGAGKSELLQTMVLGLAAQYPPERLNFLFVDYKGGASSAEFRDLPHTVGYVTNLSGRMSLRALTSLRAELQRRMHLMEGKAKDLAEMLTVAPDEAPPSLVIMVDEFAALVKEIPDFVAGIVDIAQRGRSLGIHLVLATQRPTGVVNDNILANTNLRISLRMLDPGDSRNIIGTADAADIPVPLRGRAYARTGPTALVPFQCAWAGAPMSTGAEDTKKVGVAPFAIGRDDPADVALLAASSAMTGGSDIGHDPDSQAVAEEEPPTHLEVLVDACAGAARELQLPPPRRPWVEPLPEVITLSTVEEQAGTARFKKDPGRHLQLGMYDDPANQAQHVSELDIEASGGLMIFGGGGSGKTTVLRTLAVGLAHQGDPDGVQIQVLDFASRGLDVLSDLPHCGEVVPGDDVERVTRLLTVLTREMEDRRGRLAEARAENLGALRASAKGLVMPRIVVMLDGYGGFFSAFDKAPNTVWVNRLHKLVAGGRQVGIHFVVTADRRQGVGPGLLSAISARLILRMSTSDDMSALGVPSRLAKDIDLPNGRGLLDGSTEIQVACVADDHTGAGQAEAISAEGRRLSRAGGPIVPALPELPESLVLAQPSAQRLTAPLGVADLTLDVLDVDIKRQNLVVTGPPLSGKSTALATVARGLRASSPDLRLLAIGSAASPLADLDLWDEAGFARARLTEVLKHLADDVADDESIDPRVVLFVDAAEDVDDREVTKVLEPLTKIDCLRLAVACEPTSIAKAYSGWLSALRRNRSAVMFQPESPNAVDTTIGVKPALRPAQEFPPGRAILAANRRWALIQVGEPGY